MTTHAEEFRAELATALSKALDEAGVNVTSSDLDTTSFGAILNAVTTVTWDWGVSKGAPKSHDHPEYEGPDMVRFEVCTKARELNADEAAERERRMARSQWKHGANAHEGEPPDGIGALDLLEQSEWWVTKDGQKLRLKDMAPSHRANTLALLRRGAFTLHLAHVSSPIFNDAPDSVTNELVAEDSAEWLEKQPLIRRLRNMVKADQVLAGGSE
jgi:hypothetical protein